MTGLAEYLAGMGQPVPSRDSWRWGTVTAIGPLRVRLDGDDAPLELTPSPLAVVAVGDRVWCQISGRRLIILGKAV